MVTYDYKGLLIHEIFEKVLVSGWDFEDYNYDSNTKEFYIYGLESLGMPFENKSLYLPFIYLKTKIIVN